jgi:hypothetical protein
MTKRVFVLKLAEATVEDVVVCCMSKQTKKEHKFKAIQIFLV